jgi:hypothetical protein
MQVRMFARGDGKFDIQCSPSRRSGLPKLLVRNVELKDVADVVAEPALQEEEIHRVLREQRSANKRG